MAGAAGKLEMKAAMSERENLKFVSILSAKVRPKYKRKQQEMK